MAQNDLSSDSEPTHSDSNRVIHYNVATNQLRESVNESFPLSQAPSRTVKPSHLIKADDHLLKSVKKWLILCLTIVMFIILVVQTVKQSQQVNGTSQSDQLTKLVGQLLNLLNGGLPNIGGVHAEGVPRIGGVHLSNETNFG